MNIVVDQGNTYAKLGWFQEGKLIRYTTRLNFNELIKILRKEAPENILFSSVGIAPEVFRNALQTDVPIYNLDANTPLPISKNYDTPETLGADRLAAAAGANFLFPDENLVVIDMGTCITCDLIDRTGTFQGGLISPGLKMRFRALHSFTKKTSAH